VHLLLLPFFLDLNGWTKVVTVSNQQISLAAPSRYNLLNNKIKKKKILKFESK
jgi:hypothetical protein